MSSRGHRLRAHTADVIAEAWAPDAAACIEEAIAALVSVYADTGHALLESRAHFHIAPGPFEVALLTALDDVIFTLDTSPAVPVGALVREASDGGLALVLELAKRDTVEATGAVPKAISRSGLVLERSPSITRCSFLVDV